ncbi:MAG: DUF6290 family protein [Clostridiales Family XIII bacterium]|nr:DUF6290 family protein [Clostridiales Family XIII bacterium]
MSVLAVRMSDREKRSLAEYARFHGKSMSAIVRETMVERMEEYEDIRDYEAFKRNPPSRDEMIPWSEMKEKYLE